VLTLPPFEYHAPSDLDGVLELLVRHRGDAKLIAGGTDLLPNLKHRLLSPSHLVGLRRVAGLSGIGVDQGGLRIGARTAIETVAAHPAVLERAPSLAEAASRIASPQIRRMGTLGGNLCLDTRCAFYNQTHFWRSALGFCLKKDGERCHVVPGGTRCVAAASSDTAPVLVSLGAFALIAGPGGPRKLALEDLYRPDGAHPLALAEDELLVEVRVPPPEGRVVAGYQKLRARQSIDFPLLSVAVAASLDAEGRICWIRVVLSALSARPHLVQGLAPLLGTRLDGAAVEAAAAAAYKQAHPLPNVNADATWRREVVPILVRRAFATATSAGATPGTPAPARAPRAR